MEDRFIYRGPYWTNYFDLLGEVINDFNKYYEKRLENVDCDDWMVVFQTRIGGDYNQRMYIVKWEASCNPIMEIINYVKNSEFEARLDLTDYNFIKSKIVHGAVIKPYDKFGKFLIINILIEVG